MGSSGADLGADARGARSANVGLGAVFEAVCDAQADGGVDVEVR